MSVVTRQVEYVSSTGGHSRTTGSPTSVTPRRAALKAASVGRATPAVRSSSTVVSKPARGGVQRGRPHAVVGGDADHVHRVDVVLAQPAARLDAAGVALEARVRRRVLALVEHRLDAGGVQRGVELGAARCRPRSARGQVSTKSGGSPKWAPGSTW